MAERISYEVDFSAKGAQTLWNEFIAGSESAGRALNEKLGGRIKKELLLEVKADDDGVKRLVASEREVYTELQKIVNLQEKSNKTQQGSVTSLRQQVNEAKQARDGMAKYATSVSGVSVKVGKVNGAWEVQNQRVRDLTKELDIASASNVWQKLAAEYNLKGLAGAGRQISELVNVFQSVSIIVGQVIGSVNQLFDALQKVQSIKLTFQGIGAGGDIGKVFSESSRIALGLGVNLNTVRDGFQQLSPVILATGGNINDVSAVTESLSSRFVTFGLSADKSRRVMNGVVQAFSKGKLMAEELTQQISEADPAFRTDLADAIGVSVQQLGEMVKAGQITNDVLLEAIPRMSKASGLFGNLGTTALDAARGFREGSVTVEQFRNQLATIEQLTLEKLVDPDVGPLKPLLAALLELRAVVTDVAVAFANSEVFESFLRVLGAVASQVVLVIQTIVKLGTIIASITQPIFGTLNAIDSLGGLLKGFGVISSTVAAIIVTKLVAAIVTLGAGGIVSAAAAAIAGLSAAISFLSSGGILTLGRTITASVAAILGLGAASAGTTAAEIAAAGATSARSVAVGFLTRQLGLQAAAEALAASAAGVNAAAQVRTAGGIVITGAAATGATAATTGLATATTGLTSAAGGLAATFAAALPVIGAVAAAIGALVLGIVIYRAATQNGDEITSKFDLSLKTVKESAAAVKKGFDEGAAGIDIFTAKLRALESEAKDFEKVKFDNFVLSGGLSEAVGLIGDFQASIKNISVQSAIDATVKLGSKVRQEMGTAAQAVAAYDAANDKSGVTAKKVSQDILVAQAAISTALDITRAKRAQLIEEELKNGGATAKSTIQKLAELDKEIKKLEELDAAQANLRQKAREKGIIIDVKLDIQDAEAQLASLGEKAKGLKAQVQLEVDPGGRAKLQGELNGLDAQLKFLGSDITQVKIDAKFTIDKRALDDGLGIAQAVLANLQAATQVGQSVLGLQAGYLSGQEREKQNELEILKERLGGYSKSIAGQAAIKQKENEIKEIAEQKRQIEIQALQAKLNALPAQQAQEREALSIQQQIARLELEKLKNANARLKAESEAVRIRLEEERREETSKPGGGDAAKLASIDALLKSRQEYAKILDRESISLDASARLQDQLFGLQQQTLGSKQTAESLDLRAQLAAQNGLTTQQQTRDAVERTGIAITTAARSKESFFRSSKNADRYEQSSADAASRAAVDARTAAQANKDGAKPAGDTADASSTFAEKAKLAATSTGNAEESSKKIAGDLGDGADDAKRISDELNNLDGKTIDVNVRVIGGPDGRWAGGPITGGETYRINELGREGFLSSSGTLSPINKPRNALWRAPGKGTVIPAHIMSNLDIPTGRVSTGVRPATVAGGTGANGLAKIARAIQNAMFRANKPDPGLQEMASVQAHQAQQIGKLSHAVSKLADKDWNVNVGVRNTGNTAYLDALNRRM